MKFAGFSVEQDRLRMRSINTYLEIALWVFGEYFWFLIIILIQNCCISLVTPNYFSGNLFGTSSVAIATMASRGRGRRGSRHSNGSIQHGGQGGANEVVDETDGDETWICLTCDAEYDKVNNRCFMECVICASISCSLCLFMSEAHCKAVLERDDVQWFCKSCLNEHFPNGPKGHLRMSKSDPLLHDKMETLNKNLEEQNSQMNTSVATIKAQLAALEHKFQENMSTFQESMSTFEKEVPTKLQEKLESTNTWAAMAKKVQEAPTPQISIESVKKAVHEVTEKDKEMHMRDRGVVIYRIPEKTNLAQDQRKKDDEEFVKEILHYIGCDDLVKDITHLERLGRFDDDKAKQEKYRPIKLRFNLKDQRDRMLNNLTGLKHAPDRIRRVSIRHDLNDVQRNDWYSKIKEAKEKSLASTTHIFRVRGHPGNYNVLSFPKNVPKPTT